MADTAVALASANVQLFSKKVIFRLCRVSSKCYCALSLTAIKCKVPIVCIALSELCDLRVKRLKVEG